MPRYCLGKEVNAARVCHNIIEITEMGEVGRPGDQSGMEIAELPLRNGIWPPVKEIPMRHELLGRWDNLDSLNQMPLKCKEGTRHKNRETGCCCVFVTKSRPPSVCPTESKAHTQAGLIFSSYRYFDSKQSSDVRVRRIALQDEL